MVVYAELQIDIGIFIYFPPEIYGGKNISV